MTCSKHYGWDWCHLCGLRSNNNVDVWYAENAEHDFKPSSANRYIRICSDCAAAIRDLGRGGTEHDA